MKTESEVRALIKKITEDNAHVLNTAPASVVINAPRALIQVAAKSQLSALYGILNEERPVFACDDYTKLDQ